MAIVDILLLFCGIVNLKNHALLWSNENSLNLTKLKSSWWIIESKLEIKDCENSIPCLMIENDRCTTKILIFNSPKSDIFFSTWDKLIFVYRREFQAKDIEVTDLFGDYLRFLLWNDILNIPDNYHFSLLIIKTNCCKTFIVTRERYTLYIVMRSNKINYAVTW